MLPTNLGAEDTEMNKADRNFYPPSSGEKETSINIRMPNGDKCYGEK